MFSCQLSKQRITTAKYFAPRNFLMNSFGIRSVKIPELLKKKFLKEFYTASRGDDFRELKI